MRLPLMFVLSLVTTSATAQVHVEGTARFRAQARCLMVQGAVLQGLAVPQNSGASEPFRIRNPRVRGSVQAVLDYDLQTGECTLNLTLPGPTLNDMAYRGLCSRMPILGTPTPLIGARDPRTNLELLPFITADAYGWGAFNGYLGFRQGELEKPEPHAVGFAGHFIYTTSYVPPSPIDWPAWWRFGDHVPSHSRCIWRGTLRLGAVPVF